MHVSWHSVVAALPAADSRFPDAVATIRRTGVEFQYQLVVTRAYDEGEEVLLDEDAESELRGVSTYHELTTQPTTRGYT